jgi:hypothetical protein
MDKIKTFIPKEIDGTESRETLLHYREGFDNYVSNSTNTKTYNKDTNWRVFLKPALKQGSPPDRLIDLDMYSQDEWWKEVEDMSAAIRNNRGAAVSDVFLKWVNNTIEPNDVFTHIKNFQEGLKIMVGNRIKLTCLDKRKDKAKWSDQDLQAVKEETIQEFMNGLELEFLHALGGPHFLGQVWCQENSGLKIENADSKATIRFLNTVAMAKSIQYSLPIRGDIGHSWSHADVQQYLAEKDGGKVVPNDNKPQQLQQQQQQPKPQQQQQQKQQQMLPKNVLIDRGATKNNPVEKNRLPFCKKCKEAGKGERAYNSHKTSEHKDDFWSQSSKKRQAEEKVVGEPKKQKFDQKK